MHSLIKYSVGADQFLIAGYSDTLSIANTEVEKDICPNLQLHVEYRQNTLKRMWLNVA